MNLEITEVPAGDGQLLVVYVNPDQGALVDPVTFTHYVSLDSTARQNDGWRLASLTSWPIRATGTLGNVALDSGGELTTQLAFVALYAK
jgi:hypothetical protein